MKKRPIIHVLLATILMAFYSAQTIAQTDTTLEGELEAVEVQAYGQRSLMETPAAVNTIGRAELKRYSNISILPAMNATPGVRMEERSPGSYRLSIRGSSLRSPFGVRNVKIYYNGIPVTDPGGFSYLNQFGFYNIQDIQVIKGPGSSLYGGGNGGVVLVNSMSDRTGTEATVGVSAGSYGLRTGLAELRYADSNGGSTFRYEHVESNGYRRQSGMNRNVFSWDGFKTTGERAKLSGHVLYNNLFYQTPGGLTLSEYNADPRNARPDAGSIPGAERARAAIFQDNVLAGVSYQQGIGSWLTNTTTLYTLYAQVNNPNTRNFSRTTDSHFGGRTEFSVEKRSDEWVLKLQAGSEAQKGISLVRTYKNKGGAADTLLSDEEIGSSQVLFFGQATFDYRRWILETGLGFSKLDIGYAKLSSSFSTSVGYEQLSPRFAVLYKITEQHSGYVNIARGFSPPTTAELAPSGSNANLSLSPEYGWNYEVGARGTILPGLSYDASIFHFGLSNAIVVRRDSAGGDHYINAGSTRQQGVEVRFAYRNVPARGIVQHWGVWLSYAGYNFRYEDFQQADAIYSGKQLPGVPMHTLTCGIDVSFFRAFNASITYLHNSNIALNDANTVSADPYHLLGAKIRYNITCKAVRAELFAGADNLLDEQYSLGQDINAAGGRYYNAAMPRNFYGGIVLHYAYRKE